MSEFDYREELKKQLERDVWLRHLFAKLGKRITVVGADGVKIDGKLISIQYIRGVLNLEIEVREGVTIFLNWKYIHRVVYDEYNQ